MAKTRIRKTLTTDYIINPYTNRRIKKTGKKYKSILQDINDIDTFNKNLSNEFLKDDLNVFKQKATSQAGRAFTQARERDAYIDKYKIGQTENVFVTVLFFEIDRFDDNKKSVYLNGTKYNQINKFDVSLNRIDNKYLNKHIIRSLGQYVPTVNEFMDKIIIDDVVQDKIYNGGFESEYIQAIRKLIKYETDTEFKRNYSNGILSGSIDAIYIYDVKKLERPAGVKRLTLPRLFQRNKLKNSYDNNIIINKYIKYNRNKNAEKFEDLFNINMSMCLYVQENYRANSCFINLIINTYHDELNKKNSNNIRLYKASLTYPYLCALLGIDNINQDLGITINNSFVFFERYGLGLDILNNQNEIILRYRPKTRKLNNDISPSVLRAMIYNNHIVKIDKEYDAKISNMDVSTESTILKTLWINNKYNIIKYEDDTTNDNLDDDNDNTKNIYILKYVDTIEDIFLLIKNNDDNKRYKFIYNDVNLNNVVYIMTTKHKVTPNVRMAGHNVISIYIELDKIRYIILPRTDINETEKENNKNEPFDIIEFEQYQKEDIKFYKNIFKDNHLSQYPEDVRTIENYYNIVPMSGIFTEIKKDTSILNGVDVCRAYTDAMAKIEKIPVYGQFDRYRKYTTGEQIDALKMYIVKVDDIDKFENIILFHKIYNRVYGIVLLEAQKYNIDFNILFVRDYERIEKVEYKKHIDVLYQNDKITTQSKKFIVNKVTGLLETKKNKRTISAIYDTFEEAELYKYRYINEGKLTAKITPICTMILEPNKLYESNILKKTEKTIYILTVIIESENLINGFNQIKDLIYCYHRVKMFELSKICINAKMNIYGIKTDCLLLNNTEEEINKLDITFNKDIIGAYRIELNKECNGKQLYNDRKNSLISNISREITKIDIIDEYDTRAINEKIDNTNRLLIIANVPGAGKSQIVKNYKNDDNKILFITPTRELALSLKLQGFDSMTIYKFLGLNHKEVSINTKKDFYINQYNVICFEEIYQYKRSIILRIDRYIDEHKNIKFIANGDDKQNEAIDDDDTNHTIKYIDIINMTFNKQMTLKISKRLLNENDRSTLDIIKDDIFNINIDVTTTIKKYFKTVDNMDDVRTENNITYSNRTASIVSEHIHNNKIYETKKIVIDNKIYYENMELVCRKSIRTKKLTLDTNYIYLLKSFNNNRIAIYEPVEKLDIDISVSQFKECLRLTYARTGYSIQGRTIENGITIFDGDSPYINRKWLWTALTRARELKNITFFLLDDNTKDLLFECRIKLHFNIAINKINKALDTKYTIDDVYDMIDVNTNCDKCNSLYYVNIINGTIDTNTHIYSENDKLNICCCNCKH